MSKLYFKLATEKWWNTVTFLNSLIFYCFFLIIEFIYEVPIIPLVLGVLVKKNFIPCLGSYKRNITAFSFTLDRELLPTSFSNVVAYEQTRNFPANLFKTFLTKFCRKRHIYEKYSSDCRVLKEYSNLEVVGVIQPPLNIKSYKWTFYGVPLFITASLNHRH